MADHRLAKLVGDGPRLSVRTRWQQDGKLVTPQSGNEVTFSNLTQKDSGNVSQQSISSSMPARIVDLLESVKIDEEGA